MAALDLLGIESTSFSNSVEVITRNHELTIASNKAGLVARSAVASASPASSVAITDSQ